MNDHYVTDFGIVAISVETISYLDQLAENWRTYPSKPRSKRGKYIKSKIESVFAAIRTVAEIRFATGRHVSAEEF